jgi:hypothetical protein
MRRFFLCYSRILTLETVTESEDCHEPITTASCQTISMSTSSNAFLRNFKMFLELFFSV